MHVQNIQIDNSLGSTDENIKSNVTAIRQPVKSVYTQFEQVLEAVNPFGPYQIFVCICIVFAQIEWGGNFSFVNLVGSIEPDWECQLRSAEDATIANRKMIISAPTDNEKCEFMRANCSSVKAVRESTEFNSIVASFRLICEDGDKPEAIQILQAITMMLGSIIGGHVGDIFGRQCLFYVCQFGIVVTSCLTTASTSWMGYAFCQSLNGFLYGCLEVESLALVMEYTNNHHRMIPVACFVHHIANMVIALIAHFSRDWQMFFVFLNLITSPIILAFMLFHESPRWLVAKGHFNAASKVLNDLADKRWNGTGARFSADDLCALPHESGNGRRRIVSFYHLFSRTRFAKQSLMQMLSMFTYSMIGMCYFYVISDFPFSSINILFLDGLLRMGIPVLVILLDLRSEMFTRRFQFLLSLSLIGLCFGLCSVLVGFFGMDHLHIVVVILVLIGGMLNDSLFWMNIVQVTTQRYPTVTRCIAFGCLHSFRHVGTIAGILVMQPLMQSAPTFNFVIPFALILLTLVVGVFFQPDTKGKALLDTLDELDYTRMDKVLPKALYSMAIMQRTLTAQ